MKNHLFLYTLLMITILLMVGCSTGIPQLPADNLQGNETDQENQEELTGVPRVVFIELFNTDGCASSKVINPIIEEIVAEYENTEVILVEEAGWGKYSTGETGERFKWYFSDKSELHTPSVCFDGLNQSFVEGFSSGASGNSGTSAISGGSSVTVVTGNTEDTEDNEKPVTGEVDTTNSEPVIEDMEEPVIEYTEDPEMVYPQKWAIGDGTVSNPWANDCIKKAYDAVPIGGTIYLRVGYYEISSRLIIDKRLKIIGEGIGKTFIVTDDIATNLIYMGAQDYVTLQGFTVDADNQTSGDEAILVDTGCSHITMKDIEVKNAYKSGIELYESNYSTFENIYAYDNGDVGLYSISNTAGYNRYNVYRDIYCYDNGDCGFKTRHGEGELPSEQTDNIFDNIQCWGNGQNGIEIDYQKGIVLSNSKATGNARRGLQLEGLEDSNIHNCFVALNGWQGINLIADSDNVNFTNVIAKNNNVSDAYISGIRILNSNNIILTSCQSYDDRGTPIQEYGIDLDGTNTGLTFLNCKLLPNQVGDIYNPYSAVLTVITEKMLAKL